MDLSLTEAATILDCSPRTLRDRLRRGDVPGTKRGGRWRVARRDLPLTEDQRRELTRRGDAIREAVDDVLARTGRTSRRRRSVADLEPFVMAAEIRRELTEDTSLDPGLAASVRAELDRALLALAEGAHAWDRETKVTAFRRARRALSRAVGRTLATPADGRGTAAWTDRLEQRVLPVLGGLLRWAERLDRERARA